MLFLKIFSVDLMAYERRAWGSWRRARNLCLVIPYARWWYTMDVRLLCLGASCRLCLGAHLRAFSANKVVRVYFPVSQDRRLGILERKEMKKEIWFTIDYVGQEIMIFFFLLIVGSWYRIIWNLINLDWPKTMEKFRFIS